MRARIRERLAGPASRRMSRLDRLLAQAGVAPGSTALRGGIVAGSGAAGGAALFGASGAVLGPVVALTGTFLWLRRRSSERATRMESAFPAAVRAMADVVRAGGNVQQALAQAAVEAPPPMGDELDRAVRELAVGVPIDNVLSSLGARCDVPGADVLAVALTSAVRSGADVRPVLECIVESASDRRRLARELRAATAQGRMTALVIGALPAAFLLVMGAGAGRELHFLFREPAGWALLGTGAALEAAGFAWMRRLGRPA